jgi:uncharacterized protein (UPF0548 family)
MEAEWRFARGWNESELATRLERFRHLDINFQTKGASVPTGPEWKRYYTQAIIAREKPGLPEPGGPFEKAWKLIKSYQFSDPTIVKAHYDPHEPLVGRTMLLELQVMGFRFLCGTRVNFDRSQITEKESSLGYRYDTLEGHIEAGSEWFMLTKLHETGEVRFRIHASWHLGDFPNWWSHLGFVMFGERYQLAWHRLAYLRLRHFLDPGKKYDLAPVPTGRGLVHTGEDHQFDLIDEKAGGNAVEIKRIERISKSSNRRRTHRNSKHGRA